MLFQSIPRGMSMQTTGRRRSTRLKWVKDLLVPGTKVWNEYLIRRIFYTHDAEEILRIKVPEGEDDDFIAWQFEKTGIFTVKSA